LVFKFAMGHKKFTFLFIALLGFLSSKAQLLYNNGADVAVTGGGILWVDGAVENAAGLFSNAGQTTIRGYFRNGSLATGGNAAGEYIVYGDWENNNLFTADQSIVRLTGNHQFITGTSVTTFHNLSLETFGAVKAQTLDAITNHQLNFNDCELQTEDFRMTVTNPLTASVIRSNGFVSSTGIGRFVRATNSTNNYLFPTGWNDNGNIYYRPVEIRPSVIDAQSFEARMAFGDATLEGYDTAIHAENVTKLNGRFFHLLKQVGSTTPSDLSIYYNTSKDGMWESIGRWQNLPEWEDIAEAPDTTVFTAGSPLSHRTKMAWLDNGQQPHILINTKEKKEDYNFPNVFAPNGTDPFNTGFHIINWLGSATLTDLKIFNRWGEPVFDFQRDGTTCFDGAIQSPCWNGYYQGKIQPMGNYVYQANVKINRTNQMKSAGGNLSLVW
jgi:hypothetical protein